MTEEWITTRTAVTISGYNADHLRELIREGKIDAQKFGIVWQINKQSLLDYLNVANKSSDKRRGPKR